MANDESTNVDLDRVRRASINRQNQIHFAAPRQRSRQKEINLIDPGIALRSGIGYLNVYSTYRGFYCAGRGVHD
jgi:hypothetical protein